jgi:putative transposase
VNHRVVSQAVVVATGVAADGHREVLGFEVGDSEDGAFWTSFLLSLKTRGLAGVQLVISDAHAGLQVAIASVLIGTSWQRCRVHFLRNVLAQVPKGSAEMVAAAIRTIFAQPGPVHVAEQLDAIAAMLGRQLPKVEAMLRDAAAVLGLDHRVVQGRAGSAHRLADAHPLARLAEDPGGVLAAAVGVHDYAGDLAAPHCHRHRQRSVGQLRVVVLGQGEPQHSA